jgi:hypothetical protein
MIDTATIAAGYFISPSFPSMLNDEEISDGVSRQFGVRVPVSHPSALGFGNSILGIGKISSDTDRIDIGDNTKLALSSSFAGYWLELWNEKIKAADDAVADEKRRLSSYGLPKRDRGREKDFSSLPSFLDDLGLGRTGKQTELLTLIRKA